jgi:hypothetical protein
MEENVVLCANCGKPLIKRLPNGLWHFVFGRQIGGNRPAIDMFVQGNIHLRCWRSECGFLNKLNYFPKGD